MKKNITNKKYYSDTIEALIKVLVNYGQSLDEIKNVMAILGEQIPFDEYTIETIFTKIKKD